MRFVTRMSCLFLLLFQLLIGFLTFARIFYQHVAGPQPRMLLGECKTNLVDILAPALERYRARHNGNYPDTLQMLVPGYLSKLPTCPASTPSVFSFHFTRLGGVDTYSTGYSRSSSGSSYTLYCVGVQHQAAGEPPNRPVYSPENGIQ